MDTQKTREVQQKRARSLKKAFRRFEDVKAEFLRIEWTEENEVLYYTKIVLLATFVSGMVLYLADIIVQQGLSVVNFVLRLVFG